MNVANLKPGGSPRKRIPRSARVRRGLEDVIAAAEAHITSLELEPETDETTRKSRAAKRVKIDEMRYALEWCREQAKITGKRERDEERAAA